MNILDRIVQTKHEETEAARLKEPFEAIFEQAQAVRRSGHSFSGALAASASGIIAEFKRRSPAKGFFQRDADVRTIVRGYAENGAAAISVLTDRDYFSGSLDDLRAARQVTDKPLLRKDFIVDPYQICEARIAGADAILLIAAALTPDACAQLAEFARRLGLEVLLELHGESELDRVNPHVNVVGINNRNLATFATDPAVSLHMAGKIPERFVRISESGLSDPETVCRLRQAGYQGFLMGESFMTRPDPARALGEFIQALNEKT
jgi:indole-3-glycerol phosphate synthase